MLIMHLSMPSIVFLFLIMMVNLSKVRCYRRFSPDFFIFLQRVACLLLTSSAVFLFGRMNNVAETILVILRVSVFNNDTELNRTAVQGIFYTLLLSAMNIFVTTQVVTFCVRVYRDEKLSSKASEEGDATTESKGKEENEDKDKDWDEISLRTHFYAAFCSL